MKYRASNPPQPYKTITVAEPKGNYKTICNVVGELQDNLGQHYANCVVLLQPTPTTEKGTPVGVVYIQGTRPRAGQLGRPAPRGL
eukprot:856561-Prorocentrum_minimum.AAC.1